MDPNNNPPNSKPNKGMPPGNPNAMMFHPHLGQT